MSRARTLAALLFLALLPAAKADPPAPANEEEKPIDFEPIPIEEGTPKPPTPAEWQSATRVRIHRKGPRAEHCRAWRARGWLKVHCDTQTTAASLVGGTNRGVSLWMPEPKEGVPAPPSGQVMFPIKPGDRRIFELFSFGETYGGSMVSPGLVLQEHWIEGEPAPTLVLR
ncbi:hypothetical protein [Polyangium mundeleinium]|uniref:Uncharacterized protein n=1 Tax=Polyangium mundeleinium TaxID=2995306 RepID=A0ABT5ED18_9BACT|nr:hypothetical protein [Polyangium mundeleinium]MDC0739711.1 hypothetical protein [Polyangium mundeleinium]